MSQFFETILIKDNKAQNLHYHQLRIDKTFDQVYNSKSFFLQDILIDLPKNARCKVIYSHESFGIKFSKITKREFKKFKIVDSDMSYQFKSTNRDMLDEFKDRYKEYDDIIISSNKKLKDTSIANIALFIDNMWFTPKEDLLQGTTKMRLLDSGFLKKRVLFVDDLKKCKKFAIMNAIIGFKQIEGYRFDLET